jgi:hypothetical protein
LNKSHIRCNSPLDVLGFPRPKRML